MNVMRTTLVACQMLVALVAHAAQPVVTVTIELRVERVREPVDSASVASALRAFKAVERVDMKPIVGSAEQEAVIAVVTYAKDRQQPVDFRNAIRGLGYSADGVMPDRPARR